MDMAACKLKLGGARKARGAGLFAGALLINLSRSDSENTSDVQSVFRVYPAWWGPWPNVHRPLGSGYMCERHTWSAGVLRAPTDP